MALIYNAFPEQHVEILEFNPDGFLLKDWKGLLEQVWECCRSRTTNQRKYLCCYVFGIGGQGLDKHCYVKTERDEKLQKKI